MRERGGSVSPAPDVFLKACLRCAPRLIYDLQMTCCYLPPRLQMLRQGWWWMVCLTKKLINGWDVCCPRNKALQQTLIFIFRRLAMRSMQISAFSVTRLFPCSTGCDILMLWQVLLLAMPRVTEKNSGRTSANWMLLSAVCFDVWSVATSICLAFI